LRVLEKVQIITKLKEKIEEVKYSDKEAAKKLERLLKKLTTSPDISYV
jgi:hypothetical protein